MKPLNESGTAFLLISLPAFEMSFMVKVVIDLTVITDKFLEHYTTFKLLHRPFSSSKWQVRILISVFGSTAAKLSVLNANLTKSRPIGRQLVCRDDLW